MNEKRFQTLCDSQLNSYASAVDAGAREIIAAAVAMEFSPSQKSELTAMLRDMIAMGRADVEECDTELQARALATLAAATAAAPEVHPKGCKLSFCERCQYIRLAQKS